MLPIKLIISLSLTAVCFQGCVVRTQGSARSTSTRAPAAQPKSVATHDVAANEGTSNGAATADVEPQPVVEEVLDVSDERPFVQLTGAQAAGEPADFANLSATAVWVWRTDSGQWHVRTTSADGSHVFRGRVGAPGGKLGLVQPARAEGKDRYVVRNEAVHFAFRTGSGIDGLNIAPGTGTSCTRFKFTVDGEPAASIFVGAEKATPSSHRFKICD